MPTATITLLGRATAAEDFAPLWTGTADVGAGAGTVTVTPAVPPAAARFELMLSVLSTGGSVNFASFASIPAPPPPPAPVSSIPPAAPAVPVDVSKHDTLPTAEPSDGGPTVYATRAGQARRAPFRGKIVALCLVGRPRPTV